MIIVPPPADPIGDYLPSRDISSLARPAANGAFPHAARMSPLETFSATKLLDQGNALLRPGRLEDAVASYERAIALEPLLAQAHSNRGVALTTLGRLGEAEASFDTAIALQPEYAEAFVGRATAASR